MASSVTNILGTALAQIPNSQAVQAPREGGNHLNQQQLTRVTEVQAAEATVKLKESSQDDAVQKETRAERTFGEEGNKRQRRFGKRARRPGEEESEEEEEIIDELPEKKGLLDIIA